MRKRRILHNKLKFMNQTIIDSIINEVYDKPNVVNYIKKNNYFNDGYFLDTYKFKTKLNNSYDVDFIIDSLNPNNIIIESSEVLSTYLLNEYSNLINYRDIGFTPSEIKDIYVDDNTIGTINDPYSNKTNRNEQYELLNSISYLIQEYLKNNPNIFVFSVGKNTHKNNLASYVYIFKKIFSNDFEMFEGQNLDFKYDSYYFVNKIILKNENISKIS